MQACNPSSFCQMWTTMRASAHHYGIRSGTTFVLEGRTHEHRLELEGQCGPADGCAQHSCLDRLLAQEELRDLRCTHTHNAGTGCCQVRGLKLGKAGQT